jgi:hypothetical protein
MGLRNELKVLVTGSQMEERHDVACVILRGGLKAEAKAHGLSRVRVGID